MFIWRLLSSIILVLLAIVGIYTSGLFLLVLLLFISCIAFLELTRAMDLKQDKKQETIFEVSNVVAIFAYYGAIYFLENTIYLLLILVLNFMLNMLWYVIKFPKYHANQVMISYFSFIYAPVMISFIYLTRESNMGLLCACLIFASSWGCDTTAYIVGMLIGKKKIFPILSPKKSLEGCIGGVIGAGVIGAAFGYFFYPERMLVIACICGAGAVASQIGDLAASGIKRNFQIKDYGKLIPGHGGIMDRFDSVIVTAPMIYFLAFILLK